MATKKKLENQIIEYGGRMFKLDIYGDEDYDTRGGLWDLANTCADNIVKTLNSYMSFDTDKQCDLVHETVRDTFYRLIKFRILRPIEQQLKNQNQM